MKASGVLLIFCWVCCVLPVNVVHAAPPAVVRSEPANGARDVPTDIGVLRFYFDRNMKQNSWTFWQADDVEFPPQEGTNDDPWRDPRCVELRVSELKSGTTYAVQLNSPKKQGFRSAQGDEPLPVTKIVFSTGAGPGGSAAAGAGASAGVGAGAAARGSQAIAKEDLESALRVPSANRSIEPQSGLASAMAGSWLLRTREFEMSIEFTGDGRLERFVRTVQTTETTRGTWRLNGATMEARFEGDAESLKFTVKMPDPNTLELWETPESGLRFVRQDKPSTAAPEGQASIPGGNPPAGANSVNLQQQVQVPGAGGGRPQCPQGWTEFQNPLIGMQAQVPGDYWVRLRGGMMLTVEKQASPGTMAFMMPFRPRPGASASDIAQHFARFVAESEPKLKAQIVGQPTPDRAVSQFTSVASGQPTEGRFCTILAAGGTMAFVIGVSAPQGQLDREMPTLKRIAQGFGFTPPRGRWIDYKSPAGGFTMTAPQGWQVQSGDGQSGKDNIDWVAFDPQEPLSRAFQWCPRFCSPQLLQDPLHVIRGYQAAQFQNHEQVVSTSLGQISQNVKLLKMSVNQQLTQIFRAMNQQLSQLLAGLAAARMDIVVYDCLAQAQLEGKPVIAAFVAGVQTMAINAGVTGQLMDLSVTLRGWCAGADRFVIDSPVLEKVCFSMQLSPAFIQKIVNGNAQATQKIRETYAYMNKVDDQIRQSHWDTMDAIAEMNYDNLRESGGYVNENTGRIEQISPDRVVKNSRGEYVSREEIERGVNPESATVLRDAFSNDYMRGVYGRIEF